MECPQPHEWFELERGAASPEDTERLRRHLEACDTCRARAESFRHLAASLERMAARSQADLSDTAVESLYRRARVHGLLGRPLKRPFGLRLLRRPWVRWAFPLAAAAAAILIVVIGLRPTAKEEVKPLGALEHLAAGAQRAASVGDLRALAPVARAAVGEELAQRRPDAPRLADLLLAWHIARQPREARQVEDLQFLVEGARSGRAAPRGAAARGWPTWTVLASAVVPPQSLPQRASDEVSPVGGAAPDPLRDTRALLLQGDYAEALEAIPPGEAATPMQVWCLEMLGRSGQAARLLAHATQGRPEAAIRLLQADLALQNRDVAEALRQYEALAAESDRYWFAAGYLCRYELGDARGAGLRFRLVRQARISAYVARAFQGELDAATRRPAPLAAEDFEGYTLGTPPEWPLVRARGGEFRIVEVPDGKALQQDEVDFYGAELLIGETSWDNYTLQVDVKILEPRADYVVGAVAYRRADHSGYVLELSPQRLRLVKQFAALGERRGPSSGRPERLVLEPVQARTHLEDEPFEGWWYTLKMRVQRLAEGISVAGKVWRSDTEEPIGWQVAWTDTSGAGGPPLVGGLAGVRTSGAKVLIDNLIVTRNASPRPGEGSPLAEASP